MEREKEDDDPGTLKSVRDVESESASDSDTLIHSTSSRDKETLEEYDEAERLLSGGTTLPPKHRSSKSGKGQKDGSRRRRKFQRSSSNGVYKMEEGFRDSSSNSSTDSLVVKGFSDREQRKSGLKYLHWIPISIGIVVLFCILAYGAIRASEPRKSEHEVQKLSNGTHTFKPTTIVISLDGFRADFLQRGLTPSLSAFIASGVSPQYMLPSFPSVTFPNHYTLVTGMYPESHGIVGNQFWDPHFEEGFVYTKTSISMQSKWWENAEPIWETAERKGIKTAVHMWPGSEAHIHGIDPTYLDKYFGLEKLPNKVDRILTWLDLEEQDRPQLIAAYVPDVDRDGHAFGPNSTEIRATIASADNMLTLLLEGLLQRNLIEIINLVVVSDHGMATMSASRMVQLDDLMDMSLVDHLDGWPLRGLRLKNPERDVPVLYKQLADAAKEHGTFDVYTKDTMPARYHFSNNPRIAPLWIVPKTGWLVIEKKEFDIEYALANDQIFNPIGVHGFDHEHPLMRAIFVARGPAFPHAPNSRVPVFQNIEVYNILCDSIGLSPHANNGTLRLPLQTEGLHTDFDVPLAEPVDDPADLEHATSDDSTNEEVANNSETSLDTAVTSPDATGGTSNDAPATEVKDSWWQYLHDKLEAAKDWAKEFIDSIKNNEADNETAAAG